jgi:hypothetical protein
MANSFSTSPLSIDMAVEKLFAISILRGEVEKLFAISILRREVEKLFAISIPV